MKAAGMMIQVIPVFHPANYHFLSQLKPNIPIFAPPGAPGQLNTDYELQKSQ
jgi:hypothetical protein